jgi:hypothetical protein
VGIKHVTSADATFSTTGVTEWQRDHNFIEGGGTTLPISVIADGTYLRRDGTSLTGAVLSLTGPAGPTGALGATGPANGPSARSVLALAVAAASVATTLSHPSLFFAVTSGAHMFRFVIPWNTGLAANGCKIGLTFPAAASVAITVKAPMAATGTTATELEDYIIQSGKMVTLTTAPSLSNNPIVIDGMINVTTAGNLSVIYASEVIATASGITLGIGASGIIWAMQ